MYCNKYLILKELKVNINNTKDELKALWWGKWVAGGVMVNSRKNPKEALSFFTKTPGNIKKL